MVSPTFHQGDHTVWASQSQAVLVQARFEDVFIQTLEERSQRKDLQATRLIWLSRIWGVDSSGLMKTTI